MRTSSTSIAVQVVPHASGDVTMRCALSKPVARWLGRIASYGNKIEALTRKRQNKYSVACEAEACEADRRTFFPGRWALPASSQMRQCVSFFEHIQDARLPLSA